MAVLCVSIYSSCVDNYTGISSLLWRSLLHSMLLDSYLGLVEPGVGFYGSLRKKARKKGKNTIITKKKKKKIVHTLLT